MIEAMKQALTALENNRQTHHYCEDTWYSCPKHEEGCANDSEGDECNCGADKANIEIDAAITSLRQAIREHAMYEVQRLGQEIEQEPVAWMKPDVLCDRACMYLCTKGFTQFPECATTHPPQRTWVGLTEQEAAECWSSSTVRTWQAIEAKLKELNT